MSVGLFTMRALLALLALALAAPLAEARDDAPFGGETFHEESLVRPLPDGNVVFVAHFKQEAPLSATHFETFPKAMAQIARASRVAEFELSFTQGRWDTPRWGRAPLGHRPIGAELWASFHTPDSPDVDVEAATDASWNNLTSLLGGQLCASLGRLDRAEIVVAPKLAFHPWDGTASAVVSDRPRRHGSLPAEAVCTENLTPWLKFLPCRDQSGVASLLRSRTTLFGSRYVSFDAHVVATRGPDDRAWTLELTQSLTAVLDRRPEQTPINLATLLGLGEGGGVEGACAAATTSVAHAEFGPHASVAAASDVAGEPRAHTAVVDSGIREMAYVALRTWDLTAMTSKKRTRGESQNSNPTPRFDLRVSTRDVGAAPRAPLPGYTPELHAERFVTGTGNHRGGLVVELRRPDVARVRRRIRARLFQALPWYVRVFAHTLSVEFDGKRVPTAVDAGGNRTGAHAAAVEGLRWVPPEDRTRPSTLEMQLSVPAETTTVRVSVNFEKAFLRLNEFPPDANRGFDLPSALVSLPPPKVLIFDRNIEGKPALASPLLDAMERLRGGGSERVYVGGPLLTLPTPDFSMPFNVITMVCTALSLLSGSLLATLTKRPGWDGFAEEKRKQRKKLAELGKAARAKARAAR